jgi:hypothetical protein
VNIVYVSVNQSYKPGASTDQLAAAAHSAWPLSLASTKGANYLVAVYKGDCIMAWPILGVYNSGDTYSTAGGERARVSFALGAPTPIRPAWHEVPALRRGCAIGRCA